MRRSGQHAPKRYYFQLLCARSWRNNSDLGDTAEIRKQEGLDCSSSAIPRGGAENRRPERAVSSKPRTNLLGEDGDRPAAHEVLLGFVAEGDRPQAEAQLVQELRAAVPSLRGTIGKRERDGRTGGNEHERASQAEKRKGRAHRRDQASTTDAPRVFFSRLWRLHRSAHTHTGGRIKTRGRRDARTRTPQGA